MNLSGCELNTIEAHLRETLARVFPMTPAALNGAIRDFVLVGGKRVRPQLCVWTYRNSRDDGDDDHRPEPVSETGLLDLACAWELFHAFLLAHDDIIDSADTRRGRPTLHRALAELGGGSERYGTNLAIVAGDLLFTAAMSLLHEADLPAHGHREVLRLFSRVASTTGAGQAIDICQSHLPVDEACEEVLLREYHWKTAAYTFEGPMLSGAIVAGASVEARAAISRFALALGQAYQIQNDLIDLSAEAHEGCDLLEGKRTIALLRGRAAMTDVQRCDFDRRLAALRTANGEGVRLAESLRKDLLAAGAVDCTARLIDAFLTDATAAAQDPALPLALSGGMCGLLNSLRANYFVPS